MQRIAEWRDFDPIIQDWKETTIVMSARSSIAGTSMFASNLWQTRGTQCVASVLSIVREVEAGEAEPEVPGISLARSE
jgi:hypothetical protein